MEKFNRGPKKPFKRNFRSFGPRQMHKAICAECGKECEVPFKPREGGTVYCRDCFMKRKNQEREEQDSEDF